MLLPDARRRGELEFLVAKNLPYQTRLSASFGLIVLGLIIEAVLASGPFWWAGLPVVLAGVALLLTHGYDNTARPGREGEDWVPADRERLERIIKLNEQQKDWDQDLVDITNTRGFLALAGVVVVVGALAILAAQLSVKLGVMLGANAAVMILPFWLTGVRSILKNDRLVIKVRMLLGVEDAFQGMGPREAEQFQYQLQTAPDRDTGKDIPVDVKALLLREDAPESFLGLQMQVSINSVQGADYPYFYCVIVGRPELGLQFAELGGRPSNLVVEPSHENGVDVIVIRQRTTKKSGYETKPRVANEIFRYALEQTRRILDAHAQ